VKALFVFPGRVVEWDASASADIILDVDLFSPLTPPLPVAAKTSSSPFR
jgi:hypothetical protein